LTPLGPRSKTATYAEHGTTAILDWMADNGEAMTDCLVGEPTCPQAIGDAMKIGRRGSMTTWVTVTGVQGHAAYPALAINPVHAMADLMQRYASHPLDQGSDHFDPSSLQVLTIDTGNPATNVVPAQCRATLNIRFNDHHTSKDLKTWLSQLADTVATNHNVKIDLKTRVSGESFVTPPGALSELIGAAVKAEIGREPILSTSGGTSDARFVKNHCPVVEFGLAGLTMHQVDERVKVDEIIALKRIYSRILQDYFA